MPIVPVAPARLSTMNVWCSRSCSWAPRVRAIMSVEPPGGNGTTMVTVWSGYEASAGSVAPAESAAANARSRRRKNMMDVDRKRSVIVQPGQLNRAKGLRRGGLSGGGPGRPAPAFAAVRQVRACGGASGLGILVDDGVELAFVLGVDAAKVVLARVVGHRLLVQARPRNHRRAERLQQLDE